MPERLTRFWAFAFALLAISVSAFGQLTSGNVSGTVYDPAGAAVPNVTVTATEESTNGSTRTSTTSSGQYQFTNLPIGSYTVTIEAPGFQKAEVRHLKVQLNQTISQNVTLQIASASAAVEVTDAAVSIDTTTAQIQSTFQTKQITDSPLASSGAGVINLSLLSSGVSTSGTVGVGTGPSVGGQRPRNNNFTVEGIDNNNRSVTGPLVQIPNDFIAEFTLLQNQFSPEFGHSTGGQFNTVVKSGSNSFHGMLYDYNQNRNFNAEDNLLKLQGITSNPRYDNNRLGAYISGPIIRSKLFFFTGYEYNPFGETSTASPIYGPTAAGYATLATIPGIAPNNLDVMQKYLGVAPVAAGPSTVPGTSDPSGGGYPCVTGSGSACKLIESGVVPVTPPFYQNTYTGVLSIDWNLSDKDQVRGRYVNERQTNIDNLTSLPQFYTTRPYNYHLVNISEYHSFTPTLNNELRLGYNRYNNITGVGPQVFPGLDVFPNLTIDEYSVNIGPDPNAPQYTIINSYQLADNVSWKHGKHSFRFGFDGRRYISPQGFTQRQRGDYDWSTLDGYLTDAVPDFGERSAGVFTYWANDWLIGLYGNDQWKVTDRLTLNLGLRWEYEGVPGAEKAQSLNALASVPGLIDFHTPKAQLDTFMPRVGFAYSPGASGKTSIRGGFGIGYDFLFDNLGTLSMPPQVQLTHDQGDPGTPTSNWLASGALSGAPAAARLTPEEARAATAGWIPDQKRPKSIQWNLGVQQEFAGNYTLDVHYLGTRGINLPVQDRINVRSVVSPTNQIPTFTSMPTAAQLAGLNMTLAQLKASRGPGGKIDPVWWNAGFQSNITAYMPIGNSIYHGLAAQLTRRFSHGLQFVGSYTWSHNIDDSTAEVLSTVTTPRRPQDFRNLRAERSDSALDHRQRFTFQTIYDVPFFKNRNWFAKNVLGNWEFVPAYTYQTGNWATVQSADDAMLTGETFTARSIVNPLGMDGTSSDVYAINAAGQPVAIGSGSTVAYVATSGNARYIWAQQGSYPNGGRNTLRMPPIDNIDVAATKRFTIGERLNVEFSAQFINVLNHSQYVGGLISDVNPVGLTSLTDATRTAVRNYLIPGNPLFNRPDQVFSSNPRQTTFVLKLNF
jgi:hypothetical protein